MNRRFLIKLEYLGRDKGDGRKDDRPNHSVCLTKIGDRWFRLYMKLSDRSPAITSPMRSPSKP